MPKTFKTENWVPPGGYQYTQKESGQTFRENYWANLVAKVRAHRQANNYPTGANFQQELVDFNCDLNPDWCQSTEGPSLARRMADFVVAMVKWAALGFKTVTWEQYEVRRTICHNCTEFRGEANGFNARCGRCGCNVVKLFLLARQKQTKDGCPLEKW